MKVVLVAAALLPVVLICGAARATATVNETLTVSLAGTGSGSVRSTPVGGISCPSTCSASFSYGTTVSLVPTAASGSTFAGWSGACSGTGPCTVTMNQARSVTATFALASETLSVYVSGTAWGTVTSSPSGISCGSSCTHDFAYGTSVTLTANPATGYALTGWSGACSGAGACTVTMDTSTSVTASFGVARETLTVAKGGTGSGDVSSDDGGIRCGSKCSHTYDYGTSVTLTATPGPTAKFSGWSGACSGGGECTISMTAASSVTAKFTRYVCVVPKVKGKKLVVAKRAIRKAHCSVGTVEKKTSSTVKKGSVVSESPAAGKHRPGGAKVNLVVSKGT